MVKWVTFCFVCAVGSVVDGAADVPTPEEICLGIRQRVESTFSIDVSALLDSENPTSKRRSHTRQLNIRLMGDSWIKRSRTADRVNDPDTESIIVNHNGSRKDLYISHEQEDYKRAEVMGYLDVDGARNLYAAMKLLDFGGPPKEMLPFLTSRPPDRVDPVEHDGIACYRLCWDVESEEAKRKDAFVPLQLSLIEGGILNIVVAPDLGYVTPRIEFRGRDNKLHFEYVNRDWQEVGGTWFPTYFHRAFIGPNGEVVKRVFSEITVDSHNEELPEDSFKFDLPKNTGIHDQRVGGMNRYGGADEAIPVDEFERGLPPLPGRSIWGYVVGGLLCVLGVACLFVRRIPFVSSPR